jgi:hypothetical protein
MVKRRLYGVFASGDDTKVRELVDKNSAASTTSGKT